MNQTELTIAIERKQVEINSYKTAASNLSPEQYEHEALPVINKMTGELQDLRRELVKIQYD